MTWEMQYLETLRELVLTARDQPTRSDRTGTGTASIFAPPAIRVDLSRQFPVVTTKRMAVRHAFGEMMWMLGGGRNTRDLNAEGIHIWDEWADEDGDLGRIYGVQWRDWQSRSSEPVDQIKTLIEGLNNDPYSRRHVVSAWHPGELWDMALPPCPVMFQAYVDSSDGLSLHVYQRSADWFLGVPFDIAGYALLTHVLSWFTGFDPDQLVFSYGDAHLYSNHAVVAQTQLSRTPYTPPKLAVPHAIKPTVTESLDEWLGRVSHRDFDLVDYTAHEPLRGKVSV